MVIPRRPVGSPPEGSTNLTSTGQRHGTSIPRVNEPSADLLATDRFETPELSAEEQVPPAYSDVPDQMSFSQPGLEADATIADDGRVNINISQKTRRFAELLAPALQQRVADDSSDPAPLPPAYIPPGLGGDPNQIPPPPMNIVIQIVGSRGDVQPFVALGKVLLTYGHRVRIATHGTFRGFIEDAGLEFFNIGGDPAELMAFMVKHPGLMPGFDAIKTGEISKRRRGIQDILVGCWRSCIEAGDGLGPPPEDHPRDEPMENVELRVPGDPNLRPFIADAIIANPPSFAHIHVAEKLGVPLHMMFTMPWSPTKAFPHPLANIQSANTDPVMTNHVSYALVEMMTWQGLGDVINRFRTKVLDLDPISLIWAPGLLTRLRIPYTYCWSPALIPKPNDWGNRIDISGFYFLNLASSFTPDAELAAFLEAGPPPVYIGFGSIVVDDPDLLTQVIFEAVGKSQVRALVSKGWGGLGAESLGVPGNIFMLGNVPHDWLFPRVSAVCHHGGAGTSAAGIQAGKPTIVVPFFGDQPFWGAMVHRAGAGPAPIPYKELTADALSNAIDYCMSPNTQARAEELGNKIREEKGTEEGVRSFHRHVGIDDLRCSLAPSRTAVWRVRRTKVRLSALAAATLVKNGQMQYSDLKLYRAREYNTEEQPWDPVSAVTASLVADVSTIGMAIADFPRELFKSRPKSQTGTPKLPSPKENTSKQSLTPNLDVSGPPPLTQCSVPATSSANVASSEQPDVDLPRSMTEPKPGLAELLGSMPSDSYTDFNPYAEQAHQFEPSESAPNVSPIQTSLGRSESYQSEGMSFPESLSSQSDREKQSRSRTPSASGPMIEATVERAMAAGGSVGRIVTTGVKSPMNFCLGLAKGFRNAPRLYNDDMVRPTEKVTDLQSGLKVAGKEFTFGLYDGLSGMVTQPLKGAQKEGAVGLAKGFGKGIGGLVLKPASALWSLPAYSMKGAHASIRNIFARSALNYMIASRMKQGDLELEGSSPGEQNDILVRWDRTKFDLRKWQALKVKEMKEQGRQQKARVEVSRSRPDEQDLFTSSRTELQASRHPSSEESNLLRDRMSTWKGSQVNLQVPSSERFPPSTTAHQPVPFGDEYERAIQASVAETSRGNPEEDARVEQAIRASINHLQGLGQRLPDVPVKTSQTDAKIAKSFDEEDLAITDEEYQQLIEQALKQSLSPDAPDITVQESDSDDDLRRVLAQSKADQSSAYDADNDEDLRRALEASSRFYAHKTGDEELQRAIEESKISHEAAIGREASAQREEDVVIEYIKKASLAEEQYRQHCKGKMRAVDDED